MGKFIDLTGQCFGRLTVLSRVENNRHNKIMWLCACDCGMQSVVQSGHLKSGGSRSCGCLQYEARKRNKSRLKHGLNHRPEYGNWSVMRQRCEDPNHKSYPDYGGRGITVCQGWRNVSSFIADMGERPSPEYSLDRIDVNGNYSCGHCEECLAKRWPANCRWTTRVVQNSNRRNCRYILLDDERITITEYARRAGMNKSTVFRWLNSGRLQEAL